MNPKLAKIVERVASTRMNPGGVTKPIELQVELLRQRVANDFSEADLKAAAAKLGVPESGLDDWLESFASWL